jgi:plasmid maintenance system antidote protein VapI
MGNQEKLLRAIRHKVGNTSVIDAIAGVLGISYDAAHRRVAQKSKFSIEEAIALCRHYGLSMDMLFANAKHVVVEKTAEIRTLEDMADYFKQSAEKLSIYTSYPGAKMYYSAKDIPLFHTIGGTLLSKFKLYVWLNLLAGTQNQDSFENFTVNSSLLEHSMKLKAIYDSIEINEIWNDTTINSSLQQIYYFFQSGLLSLQNARHLCEDLRIILQSAEDRCCNGTSGYHLYYNELLILNNNVLLTAPERQSLFVPYTMLGYFITSDAGTCANALDFFRHQVKNSKSLNESGTRDRKLFFNKSHHKIDHYEQRIKNEAAMDF